jgi:hypothetical protein
MPRLLPPRPLPLVFRLPLWARVPWLVGLLLLSRLHAQVARWEVDFPAAKGGTPAKSIAVPWEDGSALVVIVKPGADSTKPTAQRVDTPRHVEVLAMDPVTRVCFLKSPELSERIAWGSAADCKPGTPLTMPGSPRPWRARSAGWVSQIGPKVLPFSLLRVSYSGPAPETGTPVSTADGRVVALIYQPAEVPGSAYAIPAEAISRVRPDLLKQGKLVRGWVGITLRAETPTPQILRISEESPAAKLGILPNDILLQIGNRPIASYADAANAFFYLVPGQPIDIRIMRGADEKAMTLFPEVQPLEK